MNRVWEPNTFYGVSSRMMKFFVMIFARLYRMTFLLWLVFVARGQQFEVASIRQSPPDAG